MDTEMKICKICNEERPKVEGYYTRSAKCKVCVRKMLKDKRDTKKSTEPETPERFCNMCELDKPSGEFYNYATRCKNCMIGQQKRRYVKSGTGLDKIGRESYIADYTSGMTINDLAQKYKISSASVCSYNRKLPPRPRNYRCKKTV